MLETFARDHARLIQEEGAGVWNAAVTIFHLPTVGGTLLFHGHVENAELGDGPAVYIGQKRVSDLVNLAESRQRLDRVVTDRIHRHGVVLATECPLQLDQLRSTPRSPIGAAVEHDQSLAPRSVLVQVYQVAVLIGERHIGEPLADRWPNRLEVDLGYREFCEIWHERRLSTSPNLGPAKRQ